MAKRALRPETLLAHLGRDPEAFHGAVNVPVYHASTILYSDLEAFETRHRPGRSVVYGRIGTPTSFALEDSIARLQGGAATLCVSSGLAAISGAFLALLRAGDHVLVTDAAYLPTRKFCDGLLARFGVETSYYDPTIGAGIAGLIRPNTRLVFVESPGSLTFEMQDVPAIAAAAKAAGAATVMDTTWASPLHFRPFEAGVDVAVEAGTKYVVGHSDAMLGFITASGAAEERVRETVRQLGLCAGPDDIYLGLRGLRSLAVRLERHQATALRLATWLQGRPEVARVLYPPLPDDPGHALWQRDYSGACGLFGVVLGRPYPQAAVAAMLEGLALFGIGASWGGYESLVIPTHPEQCRSATSWQAPGPSLRIHAGLEDPDDLIADLEAGFARLNRAADG
ncbi:MAG: cystathionine beta-lyase [Kiloniellales bacterium]